MKSLVKQAVILAGGYGTRLKPFTDDNPKPMYPFEGKPFIEYLVNQVAGFGIERIVILLGYLPQKIMDYLKDGSQYGVHITYDTTPVEFETGARLRNALPLLDDTFLMMYCDNYCPIDFPLLSDHFIRNDALIQMTSYANLDLYTKDNLKIAEDGKVENYDKKRISSGLSGVDIGYVLIRKEVFDLLPEGNVNFEAAVYPLVVEKQRMYATTTHHRYYSVGSWERIELTKSFFSPRKFAFLDRDGTLNVRAPQAHYIEKPEEFIWLDGAKEAVKLLNENGYTVLIVSNQPGIARGNLTTEILTDIHDKMLRDLKDIGAKIDNIYYCPHNWDDGCFCRKPKPGLLYEAQRDYSINLRTCVLFGDDERDITAGQAAGCRCIFVSSEYPLLKAVTDYLK